VDSGCATSIEKRLVGSLDASQEDISQELSIRKTVMTAAEAKIATAAMAATDKQDFPVVAVAIFTAPVEADAPVKMAAWTAMDWRVEFNLNPFFFPWTILTISVYFMVVTCTLQLFLVVNLPGIKYLYYNFCEKVHPVLLQSSKSEPLISPESSEVQI
jgi:hypothetical protein